MFCTKKNSYLKLKRTLKEIGIFSFVILAMVFGGNANAQQVESGIKEFWQELYIYNDFGEKLSGEILFNNLYSSQLGNYDWFLEGEISFHANEWLDIEALYRYEFYDLNSAKVQEYRPMVRFSGKTQIGNWSIRNRHRFELRIFEKGENKFRYRTDLKIKPNLNWTCLKLNPYLLEEIFISERRLSRNRIYGGIEGKKGRFEPAVYMLMQSDYILNNWNNRFIIGVVLGLELEKQTY